MAVSPSPLQGERAKGQRAGCFIAAAVFGVLSSSSPFNLFSREIVAFRDEINYL
jgi:hypothetical protein